MNEMVSSHRWAFRANPTTGSFFNNKERNGDPYLAHHTIHLDSQDSPNGRGVFVSLALH